MLTSAILIFYMTFQVYKKIKNTIKRAVEGQFEIGPGLVHLTSPTFFSEISDRPARTEHDEYWHVHVDKVTYGSFDYTCLLYLTDYNDDFEGGEFWFENKTSVVGVEPRLGRLVNQTKTQNKQNFQLTHRHLAKSRGYW